MNYRDECTEFYVGKCLRWRWVASLRIDPQGKAFAQQLLDMPVKVPAHLLEK
jgi:hypothetical protein